MEHDDLMELLTIAYSVNPGEVDRIYRRKISSMHSEIRVLQGLAEENRKKSLDRWGYLVSSPRSESDLAKSQQIIGDIERIELHMTRVRAGAR